MERHGITIMGIINLTEDSFWSGSRMLGADAGAVADRAAAMVRDGAGMIDIGACSTRPGSAAVGEEEEWRRIRPMIQRLSNDFPALMISIDTYWASVIRNAYDVIGNRLIINDISAGEADSAMLPLAGNLGIPFIAMHMRGTPATMQTMTDYSDFDEAGDASGDGRHLHPVTKAVVSHFRTFEEKAQRNGISDWMLDPGFGFAKTVEQNWQLMDEMAALRCFGKPLLVGVSRKSMLTKPLGISPAEALTPTQVANFAALERGADILRVHDVAAAAQTVRLFQLLHGEATAS